MKDHDKYARVWEHPLHSSTHSSVSPRGPGISIIIPVAGAVLGKTLVFIGLFAVTQRSFAS